MATYKKMLKNRRGDNIIPAFGGQIDTGDIADGAITTGKIADGAVTNAKIDWTTVPGLAQVVTSLPATGSENVIYLEREGTTASGKFIHITDSAPDSPLEYFNLYGETTQSGTPTPSSPVAVQTVTGRNVVKICGKNLIDTTITPSNQYLNNAGGWSTDPNNVQYINQKIMIGGNTNLTLSWGSSSPAGFFRVGEFKADGTFIQRTLYGGGATPTNASITTNANCGFLIISMNAGDSYITNPMLEYGSTATAYEPYQGQSYEINLGKNLVRQIQDFTANGLIFSTRQDGTTHIQGTPTSIVVNDTDISDIVLNPGTYTFSYSYNGTQPPENSGAVQLRKYDPESETGTTVVALNAWVNSSVSFTLTEITKLQRLRIFFNANQSINCDVSVQLEKGSTASSFAAYFDPIELCKLGTYQDYIYKNGSKWYIHKATGKAQITTLTSASATQSIGNRFTFAIPAGALHPLDTGVGIGYSNMARLIHVGGTWDNRNTWTFAGTDGIVQFAATESMTLADANTWLASHPFYLYYPLTTPTDTEITNAALVSQLNNILNNAITYDRITNIYTNTENEQGTLGIGYYNAYGSYLYIGGKWYKFSRLTYGE